MIARSASPDSTALPIWTSSTPIPDIRDLHHLRDIEKRVEYFVRDRQFFDFAVRENLLHLIERILPLVQAPKIIHVKEAAAVKVFAHAFGLGVGEVQRARFDYVYIRIVKQRGIHDPDRAEFLADVDVGQSLYAVHEL